MYNEGALLSRAAAAFSLSLRLWFVRRREAAVEALSVEAAEAVESPLLEAQGDGGRSVDIVPPTGRTAVRRDRHGGGGILRILYEEKNASCKSEGDREKRTRG
jgi:hypothetical protein